MTRYLLPAILCAVLFAAGCTRSTQVAAAPETAPARVTVTTGHATSLAETERFIQRKIGA